MKNFVRIMGIIFAFISTLTLPVIFSGCDAKLTMKEGAKAMVEAADNYQKVHESYDNFANSTYTYKSEFHSAGTTELTYIPEGATEEVTNSFTNTINTTKTITMATYNVLRGEGDEAIKYMHFYVNVVEARTGTIYSVENDALKTTITNETITKTYTMATKLQDDEVEYYITYNERTTEPNEDDVVENQFFKYDDEYAYYSSVTTYLEKINDLVYNSFFPIGEQNQMLLMLANYTKSGNKVEMDVEVTMPSVSAYNALLTTTTLKATIVGKNIDTTKMKMIVETVSDGSMEMGSELKFANGADEITVPTLTGYTELEDEIDISDIPTKNEE